MFISTYFHLLMLTWKLISNFFWRFIKINLKISLKKKKKQIFKSS